MRKTLIVLTATGLLAGCQTWQPSPSQVTSVCEGAKTAHAVFVSIAPVEGATHKMMETESIAYAQVKALCDRPAGLTVADIMVHAAVTYALVRQLQQQR